MPLDLPPCGTEAGVAVSDQSVAGHDLGAFGPGVDVFGDGSYGGGMPTGDW